MQPSLSAAYTTAVVDADGTEVSNVGSDQSAWFDASTIGVAERQGLNFWAGPDTVELYSVDGSKTADLQGSFSAMLVGFGHVAVAPHNGGLSPSDTFQLWDGDNLSAPIAGFPWAWSADGTRLAVLHGRKGDYYVGPGDPGTIEVVDDKGDAIASFSDLVAATSSGMYFSPDNRYLAIDDAVDKVGVDPFDVVVDTQTSTVEKLGPPYSTYGLFGWTNSDTLYMGSPDGPSTWTPDGGYKRTSIPKNSVLAVSEAGLLAYWPESSTRLTIRSGGNEQSVDLPGAIDGTSWSPEGSRLAVTYSDEGASTPMHLTILQAPHFAFAAS